MYSTSQLIAGIQKEYDILKHLGSKVTADNKDHKLTDWQRSIEELEQYIVSSFPAQIKLMVAGHRDQDLYMSVSQPLHDGFDYTQFSVTLDKSFASISEDINSLTDDQWLQEISLWGRKWPRSMFLVDYVFTFLGAYRMQLFLQLKSSGLTDLGTHNLWGWADAPKQA